MKKMVVSDLSKFDGEKFAKRYGLKNMGSDADFYFVGKTLHYPDRVPDNPVLEAPDPPPVKPTASIDKITSGVATLSDVVAYCKWDIQCRRLDK